eukprot:scpid38124/ scgid6406/ 
MKQHHSQYITTSKLFINFVAISKQENLHTTAHANSKWCKQGQAMTNTFIYTSSIHPPTHKEVPVTCYHDPYHHLESGSLLHNGHFARSCNTAHHEEGDRQIYRFYQYYSDNYYHLVHVVVLAHVPLSHVGCRFYDHPFVLQHL